jgi:hypothetical protein
MKLIFDKVYDFFDKTIYSQSFGNGLEISYDKHNPKHVLRDVYEGESWKIIKEYKQGSYARLDFMPVFKDSLGVETKHVGPMEKRGFDLMGGLGKKLLIMSDLLKSCLELIDYIKQGNLPDKVKYIIGETNYEMANFMINSGGYKLIHIDKMEARFGDQSIDTIGFPIKEKDRLYKYHIEVAIPNLLAQEDRIKRKLEIVTKRIEQSKNTNKLEQKIQKNIVKTRNQLVN